MFIFLFDFPMRLKDNMFVTIIARQLRISKVSAGLVYPQGRPLHQLAVVVTSPADLFGRAIK